MNAIWNGQEKLWKIFWGGIFFPVAILFVMGFAGALFHFTAEVHALLAHPWFSIGRFIYIIIWAAAVWKCRRNCGSVAWKYLALFTVLLFIILNVGLLAQRYHPQPLTAFNPSCIKTLEDFAQQNNLNPQQYVENNRPYLQKCTKEFYRNNCIKTMQDFAAKNGLNAQDYLKQNQAYLNQCVQSLDDKQQQSGK